MVSLSDLPLSYFIQDVKVDSSKLNSLEFTWDPSKDTGVYIKVHCISTEFTAKKHGGEKGVPFRVQVETYLQDDEEFRLVHCASCQIKVFKVPSHLFSYNSLLQSYLFIIIFYQKCKIQIYLQPKGADRKHKTDREKMEKRSDAEKEKYQPSYECTVLAEVGTLVGYALARC